MIHLFNAVQSDARVKLCTGNDITPDAKAKGVVTELCGRDLDAKTAAEVGALLLYIATVRGGSKALENALVAKGGIDAESAVGAAANVCEALRHMAFYGSEI